MKKNINEPIYTDGLDQAFKGIKKKLTYFSLIFLLCVIIIFGIQACNNSVIDFEDTFVKIQIDSTTSPNTISIQRPNRIDRYNDYTNRPNSFALKFLIT